MASTAFVSEYYDNRTQGAGPGGPGERAGQATSAHGAPAFVQDTPPSMYHQGRPKHGTPGRGTVIVSAALRMLTFLSAVVALAILASSSGKFGFGQSVRTVKFTTLRAFTYLFAACCIVAVYSLLMTVVDIVGLCVSSLAGSKVLLAIMFVCDQVLAYILISAAAVGANGVMASNDGENLTGFPQRMLACEGLGLTSFCSKAAASVALAFIAFLFLATTSVLSTRRLFRP